MRSNRLPVLIERARKHPFIVALLTLSAIVIGFASFTDALHKLTALVPQQQSPASARSELARLSLPFESATLFERARVGDVLAVRLLLRAGIAPDVEDDEGVRALTIAAAEDQHEVVAELLHAGAKLEVGRYGKDPLYCAASNGHGEMVQRLLAAGSSPQSIEDAFIEAARCKHDDSVRALAPRVMDMKHTGAIAMLITSSNSVAEADANRIISLLLDLGADPNGADSEGVTPLLMVAKNGQLSATETLLNRGANANARCACTGLMDGGWTPLTLSIRLGHEAVARRLIEHGADITIRNERGQSAVELAKRQGPAFVELVAKGKGRSGP